MTQRVLEAIKYTRIKRIKSVQPEKTYPKPVLSSVKPPFLLYGLRPALNPGFRWPVFHRFWPFFTIGTKELMFIVCLLVCLFVCLLVCLFTCLFTWCYCNSCPLFRKYEKSILSYFYETTKKSTYMTFDLEPRSKLNAQNESPYMISYMSAIQSRSLSCSFWDF